MPRYRKRFERSKEPPKNFRIQTRDYGLLADIAGYGVLSTEQIFALHKGGERNLRRRLAALYHLGYIERPKAQKLLPPGSFIIYSLGRKGAELLHREESVGKRHREVSFPHLSHALMISRFRSILSLALKGGDKKIEKWMQGRELYDTLSKREKTDLVPDAFFTVESKEYKWPFFLEADMGTMTRTKMLEKYRTYWRWWRERRHEHTLGIQRFRVLTIAPSETRTENLVKAAKEADDRRTGSDMFLFLSETAYSLKEPEEILKSVWLSAKGGRHGILE